MVIDWVCLFVCFFAMDDLPKKNPQPNKKSHNQVNKNPHNVIALEAGYIHFYFCAWHNTLVVFDAL